MNDTVYLDHNATTTTRPEAARAMAAVLAATGNPSSVHGPGRAQRKVMEDARAKVAALAGAAPEQVVFTSGGTEANNLAVRGCGRSRILISAVEHPAVTAPALEMGAEIVPVDGDGIVDLERLGAMLGDGDTPALVSVMLANNETGVIEPVAEVARIAHEHGALVHCDAVQAAGKIALDIGELGVDMLSLAAHKIGGPSGVGALILGAGYGVPRLRAVMTGGGQERGLRPGTENLPGIAGFGAAAEVAAKGLGDFARLAELRDRLEAGVKAISPDAVVFAATRDRLANTSYLALPGGDAVMRVMAFDLAGIAISAGSACSSGKVKASGVLAAMAVADDIARRAVRVSLGWSSTPEDVDAFLGVWKDIHAMAPETAGKKQFTTVETAA